MQWCLLFLPLLYLIWLGKEKMRILSLFANIGVAEARLNEVDGVDVVVANELVPRRAKLYQRIYPRSNMICGDILDDSIYRQVINSLS